MLNSLQLENEIKTTTKDPKSASSTSVVATTTTAAAAAAAAAAMAPMKVAAIGASSVAALGPPLKFHDVNQIFSNSSSSGGGGAAAAGEEGTGRGGDKQRQKVAKAAAATASLSEAVVIPPMSQTWIKLQSGFHKTQTLTVPLSSPKTVLQKIKTVDSAAAVAAVAAASGRRKERQTQPENTEQIKEEEEEEEEEEDDDDEESMNTSVEESMNTSVEEQNIDQTPKKKNPQEEEEEEKSPPVAPQSSTTCAPLAEENNIKNDDVVTAEKVTEVAKESDVVDDETTTVTAEAEAEVAMAVDSPQSEEIDVQKIDDSPPPLSLSFEKKDEEKKEIEIIPVRRTTRRSRPPLHHPADLQLERAIEISKRDRQSDEGRGGSRGRRSGGGGGESVQSTTGATDLAYEPRPSQSRGSRHGTFYGPQFRLFQVVWAKMVDWPWWPATILSFKDEEGKSSGMVSASVKWFGRPSSCTSILPSALLFPFEEGFSSYYLPNKKKKTYRRAIQEALEAIGRDPNDPDALLNKKTATQLRT